MAKNNPGDVLTRDWNPIIGCERYSPGCANCWYIDGIFPWLQRKGQIPKSVKPTDHFVFSSRLTPENLKLCNGIVGIVQHGDLFWDGVPDAIIHKVLDIIEEVAPKKRLTPKYILWTKRAERMSNFLSKRYPKGLPAYLAVATTVENQSTCSDRLPHLKKVKGSKIIVVEPILGKIDLTKYLKDIKWVIVGSETGKNAQPIELDWARKIRDDVKERGIPFFIKQLGGSHKKQLRQLDGQEWNEFPDGFSKGVSMARLTKEDKFQLGLEYLKGTGLRESQVRKFIEVHPTGEGLDTLYNTYEKSDSKEALAATIRYTIGAGPKPILNEATGGLVGFEEIEKKKRGRPSKLDKDIEKALSSNNNIVKVIDKMTDGLSKAQLKDIITLLKGKMK